MIYSHRNGIVHTFLKSFLLLLAAASFSISNANDSIVELKACESHVGPLTGKTKFDQRVIQDLFPNYLVKTGVKLMGFYSRPALEVIHDKKIIVIISPDTSERFIGDVEILSRTIGNVYGPRVGWTYVRTFKNASSSECRQEVWHMDQKTLCRESKSKHIYYVFMSYDFIAGADSIPNVPMDSDKIEEIIWRP
jgi:hypothetical protein